LRHGVVKRYAQHPAGGLLMRKLARVSKHRVLGFTMIEILVALLIVLISIMGVAALLMRTIQQEVEASQRIEALVLLQDMVDRINSNRQVADCYSDGDDGVTLGTAGTLPQQCNGRADVDLETWHNALLGASTQEGSANVGAMIGARGCIDRIADRTYRVTVAWQGLAETFAQANNDCGQDQYGDERLRRVVTAVVRIGDLQ
jgi:type IV pilus assembly protein PilV